MNLCRRIAQILHQHAHFAAIARVDHAARAVSRRAAIEDLSRSRAPSGSPVALVNSMATPVGIVAFPRGAMVTDSLAYRSYPRSSPGCAMVGAFADKESNFTFSIGLIYSLAPAALTLKP